MRAATLLLVVLLTGAAPQDASLESEMGRAAALLEAGQPARAAELVRSLLLRGDSAALRNLLGDALEASGDPMGAAEEFQKAAHADPSEEHLFDWGNCLLQLRAYEPATRVLTESVRRYPRSARLHVALGIARYSRGQFDEAVRSFGEATDLEPDDPRPYLFLGEMYGVSQELATEVTRRLARFVERQPSHALGQFYYAMILWQSHPGVAPGPEVESGLKKAVALDPALARAHFQLGVLYADARRYPEAIAALEKATGLDPSMAQAYYRLGQAYRRIGQEEQARKALEAFDRLQRP